MKNAIVLILILALLLCGCSIVSIRRMEDTQPTALVRETETQQATTETALPTVYTETRPELAAYEAVLKGNLDIYNPDSGQNIPLSHISLFFTLEEMSWTVEGFAVQDLDGDGTLEAVLEVSDYMGYVLLRCREETVTGRGIWYRAFQDLKADGSYLGSGSSSNHSYWQFHHSGDILLAECYDNGSEMVYWVNGQRVDAAAFAAFEETQQAKPNAVWYTTWSDFIHSQSK